MAIKTGQTVKVITGKDKGKVGKVTQVFPRQERVVVEGVNKTFKHLKPGMGRRNNRSAQGDKQKGERVEYFAPIHMSNVIVTEEAAKSEKPKADNKK